MFIAFATAKFLATKDLADAAGDALATSLWLPVATMAGGAAVAFT